MYNVVVLNWDKTPFKSSGRRESEKKCTRESLAPEDERSGSWFSEIKMKSQDILNGYLHSSNQKEDEGLRLPIHALLKTLFCSCLLLYAQDIWKAAPVSKHCFSDLKHWLCGSSQSSFQKTTAESRDLERPNGSQIKQRGQRSGSETRRECWERNEREGARKVRGRGQREDWEGKQREERECEMEEFFPPRWRSPANSKLKTTLFIIPGN